MSSSFQQNVTAVVDALFPSSSSSSSSASNKKQMRPKIQPLPRDQRRTTTTSSEDYDEEQDNDNDNDNDNDIDYGSFDSDCLTSWIYSSSVFDTKNITKNITPSSSSSSSIYDENEFFGTKTTTTFAAQTYALHRNGNSNNNSDSDSEGNLIMIKQTMRQSALGNNNNSNNNNSNKRVLSRRTTRNKNNTTSSLNKQTATATSTSQKAEEEEEEENITSLIIRDMPELELDKNNVERIKLQTNGWEHYDYKEKFRCNYISAGKDNKGPIVVLVHGFGAHSYHWRYQIPYLAKRGYRVYALCMLGYGWSSKASEEKYCMEYWGEQVSDFVKTQAKATKTDKAFIAGNSIGALAALYAASKGAPEVTKGLCLVNAAGNFDPNAPAGPEKKTMAQKAVGTAKDMEEAEENNTIAGKLRVTFGKLAAYGIFYFTKIRIKTILNQVYDNDVDEDLVRSIAMAAEDPKARETFYAISLAGSRTQVKPRDLLEKLDVPVMLLWGENDPWMTPSKAERILEIKPNATYSPVSAGHCPQDDNPVESNDAFLAWAKSIA